MAIPIVLKRGHTSRAKLLFEIKVLTLDFCSSLGYTINMMKVGDLVTLKPERGEYGLIECAEVGIVQKMVPMIQALPPQHPGMRPKNVYHVRWTNGDISNHYSREIVIVSEV
jgi:hypothetical protein